MGKKVLVAPLDWGLGHATRCVPLIRALEADGHEVILAAGGRPFEFLKTAFPHLRLIKSSGYDITYPSGGDLKMHLLANALRIRRAIQNERKEAERLVRETGAEVILSDNRMNFRTDGTKNIYVTHQINIKAGWLSTPVTLRHRSFYERFDELWIPDFSTSNRVAGDLSDDRRLRVKHRYIGPLTRLRSDVSSQATDEGHLLFMISGPESQRTIFETEIFDALKKYPLPAVVLRGLPGESSVPFVHDLVKVYPHADVNETAQLIAASRAVICRGGYSTLCDLIAFRKKVVMIPTPGQSEQEYLATYHSKAGRAAMFRQGQWSIEEIIDKLDSIQPFSLKGESELAEAIRFL